MRNRLIPLMFIAVLSLGSGATYAKALPAAAMHQNLLDLIPETLTEESSASGFCDLHPMDARTVGRIEAPISPWAGEKGQSQCVLPVPPRDVFEHIASLR